MTYVIRHYLTPWPTSKACFLLQQAMFMSQLTILWCCDGEDLSVWANSHSDSTDSAVVGVVRMEKLNDERCSC